MNLTTLLHGQTALVLAIILSGLGSPFVSALLTKAPTFLTGVLTTLITSGVAFLTEWQANPHHFDWKSAASAAVAGWALALFVHNGWIKDTTLQDSLHTRGLQMGPAAHPNTRTAHRKAA